jgi:hypothetical protein
MSPFDFQRLFNAETVPKHRKGVNPWSFVIEGPTTNIANPGSEDRDRKAR